MQETERPSTRSIKADNSLGERLRHARELRGLTQEEVARVLCLNVDIISALESDNYDYFAVRVYAKGYIRNYATYLHMPIPDLDNINESQSPYTPKARAPEDDINQRHFLNRLLLQLFNVVIVIVLIWMITLWWNERHQAAENAYSILNMSMHFDPYQPLSLSPPPPLLQSPQVVSNSVLLVSPNPALLSQLIPGWPADLMEAPLEEN